MKCRSVLTTLLVLSWLVGSAGAQRAGGSISGVIRDGAGAALPGATVSAAGPSPKSVVTASDGVYRLLDLEPGVYRLEVRAPGFAPAYLVDVQVRADAPVEWSPRVTARTSGTTAATEYLELLVGKDSRACGLLGPTDGEHEMSLAMECGKAASAGKVPFVVMRRTSGTDSELATGLFGNATGAMFLFDYESRPCGGTPCESRFSFSRCWQPWVGRRMGVGDPVFLCRTRD